MLRSDIHSESGSVATKLLISVLVLGLLVTGGFLGRALIVNWLLEADAKRLASEAGLRWARDNFTKGRLELYEIKPFKFGADDVGRVPDEGATEPTGRREGPFEIRYFLVNGQLPSVHVKLQQTYVEAYNMRMRQFHEKPDWFDTNGFRVARPLKSGPTVIETNSTLSKKLD